MCRRLYLGVRTPFTSEISRLHRRLACRVGMSVSGRNDRLLLGCHNPTHGVHLPPGLHDAELASVAADDRHWHHRHANEHVWCRTPNKPPGPRTSGAYLWLLLHRHPAAGVGAKSPD
jgi:hypothetical protein